MYIADPASEVLDHTPHQWLSLVAVVAGVAVLVLGLLPGGIIAVANASTAFVK
jgi:hypothetical protein